MSEPFPSKALIALSRDNALDMVPMSWEGWEEGMIHTGLQKHLIPLFQPRQIIEMLEESGYSIALEVECDCLASVGAYTDDIKWAGQGAYDCIKCGSLDNCPHYGEAEGPDPATALLKAYLGG